MSLNENNCDISGGMVHNVCVITEGRSVENYNVDTSHDNETFEKTLFTVSSWLFVISKCQQWSLSKLKSVARVILLGTILEMVYVQLLGFI